MTDMPIHALWQREAPALRPGGCDTLKNVGGSDVR